MKNLTDTIKLFAGSILPIELFFYIKKTLQEKCVVVLGLRATGKTTLLEFLEKGELPARGYKQTESGKAIEIKKPLKLKNLKLVLKNTYDTGGEQRYHSTWEKLILDADIIIYLFRIDKWKENPFITENEILGDLGAIDESVNNRLASKKKSKVFIIGTHVDKDPEWKADAENHEYEKAIVEDPFIRGMQSKLGGTARCKVLLGSMQDKSSIGNLLFELLCIISQD